MERTGVGPADGDVAGRGAAQAEATSPSAALVAPLRTVRRSTLEESNHLVPPTKTPLASSREAQSPGPQCEGGVADARGLTIVFAMVILLESQGSSVPRRPPR